MVKSVLQIKNLSKKIGKKSIVRNINFEVYEGEVFGLLGPNGAGKTTIIRAIVSLISRSSGTVLVNGEDVSVDYKGTISQIGGIIENPEFYMYLTGMENLQQYIRMSRYSVSDEWLQEVIERVKLSEAINQKVKTYSLGMRQRLGLAQALLHKPAILILDEPTNGLDPQGMAEFRSIIQEVSQQGTAVLISSHLLGEVQQITDRFAIIEKGELTHIQDMSELQTGENSTYRLKVGQVDTSLEVLKQLQFKVSIVDNDVLEVQVNEEQVPVVIRELVKNDVDIFQVEHRTVSLEEKFFELTEGGSL